MVGSESAELDLTPSQHKELQTAFHVFDTNGEGTITNRKLFMVMRSLGLNPTEAEVQDLINAVDDDGNGTIEYEEFVQMMSRKIKEHDGDDEVKTAFKCFDRAGKGGIDAEDLHRMFTVLSIDTDDISDIIKVCDSEGKGLISLDDVMNLYRSWST